MRSVRFDPRPASGDFLIPRFIDFPYSPAYLFSWMRGSTEVFTVLPSLLLGLIGAETSLLIENFSIRHLLLVISPYLVFPFQNCVLLLDFIVCVRFLH